MTECYRNWTSLFCVCESASSTQQQQQHMCICECVLLVCRSERYNLKVENFLSLHKIDDENILLSKVETEVLTLKIICLTRTTPDKCMHVSFYIWWSLLLPFHVYSCCLVQNKHITEFPSSASDVRQDIPYTKGENVWR